MSRYAGTTDLRAYISPNGSLPNTDNGLLQSCLNRAEAAIDSYTRRNFLGTAGTYVVNRFGQVNVAGQALYLDTDLVSLVSVTNGDATTIPLGSVWLEPRNEGPPYRIVRLKSSYVWVWNTDSDVTLAGTFGFGTVVPDDIVQATIRTAAYYYRQKDTGPGDVAGFPDGGEVQVAKGLPDDVRWLLSPYRSRSGGMI